MSISSTNKRILVPSAVAITLVLLWAIPLQAEGVGIVTAVRGTATVSREPTPQPKSLSFKDDLFWQDTLNTGTDSRLRMLILKKSVITMKEQSRLQLREEAPTPTQPRGKSVVNLLAGSVRAVVEKDALKEKDYEIRTNIAVAAIRGSDIVGERTSAIESSFYTGPGATASVIHANPAIGTRDLAELSRARVLPTAIEITPITRSFYDTLRAAIAPGGAAAREHRPAKSEKAEIKSASQGGRDAVRAAAGKSVSAAIDRGQDAVTTTTDPTSGTTGSGTQAAGSSGVLPSGPTFRSEPISDAIRKEAKGGT